ncbi:MAG: hypothetical protein FWH46_03785 [Methanimicrococcus sp.]|nr:hypothetical protein [Methanimicrococcus sp.]
MTSLQKKALIGILPLLQRGVLSQTVLHNIFFSFPPLFGKNNDAAVIRSFQQTNVSLKTLWSAAYIS